MAYCHCFPSRCSCSHWTHTPPLSPLSEAGLQVPSWGLIKNTVTAAAACHPVERQAPENTTACPLSPSSPDLLIRLRVLGSSPRSKWLWETQKRGRPELLQEVPEGWGKCVWRETVLEETNGSVSFTVINFLTFKHSSEFSVTLCIL